MTLTWQPNWQKSKMFLEPDGEWCSRSDVERLHAQLAEVKVQLEIYKTACDGLKALKVSNEIIREDLNTQINQLKNQLAQIKSLAQVVIDDLDLRHDDCNCSECRFVSAIKQL